MRSVVVVFPASMCAMMPRFRVRSRGACLFKSSSENKGAAVPALHSGCGAERPSQHERGQILDRKSTRLNSSHLVISYAVFCLKKKKKKRIAPPNYIRLIR